MSLFDGYADPDQFRDSGGLLGRLLSLRPDLADQMQGQARVDRPAFVPRAPALTPMFWSNSAASYNAQSGGLASSSLQSQPGLNSSDLGQSWLAQALANTQRLFDVPTAIPSLTAFQPMAFQVATAAPPPIVPTPAPDTSQNVAVSVNPETLALANASGSQPPLPPSQLLSNDQHATSAASGLLADFYRQTILQAGKDIAGYFNDAVNDPAAFVHAIGPSLAGLGPAVTELPGAIKGVMGAIGILQKGGLPEAPPLPEAFIGNNARPGRGRVKTDLPGIDPTPEELFDKLTGGRSETLPTEHERALTEFGCGPM